MKLSIDRNGFFDANAIDAPTEKEIAYCIRWLRSCTEPVEKLGKERSSYGYKHDVERYLHEEGTDAHIPNGALIIAAHREGYRVERDGDTPNAFLNIHVHTVTPK